MGSLRKIQKVTKSSNKVLHRKRIKNTYQKPLHNEDEFQKDDRFLLQTETPTSPKPPSKQMNQPRPYDGRWKIKVPLYR